MKRKDIAKQIVNERERLKFHMTQMMFATDKSCAARHAKEMKECAERISALKGKLIDIQSDKN